MQKQKLKPTFFLAVQNTYENVELALFLDDQMIDCIQETKFEASKMFITHLEHLLKRNMTGLADIIFIAANQGPGPFASLRTVIASINGIAFASNIPLVGIDSIQALLHEYHTSDVDATIALLNACNKEVYFGIAHHNNFSPTKCAPFANLLPEFTTPFASEHIQFVGNASTLYQNEITSAFGQHCLPLPIPQTCSIKQIGLMGLTQWQSSQDICYELLPRYIKQMITP